MLFGQAQYSTSSHFYYLQAKTGFTIAPDLFVGPEIAFSGGRGDDQIRFGGHVSAFKFGLLTLGVSVGFVRDSNYGKGVYAGTSLQAEF